MYKEAPGFRPAWHPWERDASVCKRMHSHAVKKETLYTLTHTHNHRPPRPSSACSVSLARNAALPHTLRPRPTNTGRADIAAPEAP